MHPGKILQDKSKLAARESWLTTSKESPGHLFKKSCTPGPYCNEKKGNITRPRFKKWLWSEGLCERCILAGVIQIFSFNALHLNRFKLLELYMTASNFSQGIIWTDMMKCNNRYSNSTFHCLFVFGCRIVCYRICFLFVILTVFCWLYHLSFTTYNKGNIWSHCL